MAKPIGAAAVQWSINYFYLVSFCPQGHVTELKKAGQQTQARLARQAGLKPKAFVEQIAPEVARRVVAFQQATRKPEEAVVQELAGALLSADESPQGAAAFQAAMRGVATHPGRARKDHRLHRQKGCGLCVAPCLYGFFSLMSEPDFKPLMAMLDAENQKPSRERNAVNVLWAYTRAHLWQTLGAQSGYIYPVHLGNLSYCLLMLAIARSRFALPEDHIELYQALNQRAILSLGATPIDLAPPK
jgi:hypothetical protein